MYSKGGCKQRKGQSTENEKISAKEVTNTGLIAHTALLSKKQNSQTLAEDLNRYFFKEHIQMAKKERKDAQDH